MPKVYNCQIGRPMSYPYEEKHPRWQFAFVFNINRCIGCQTCTMACKSTWTFSKGQEYMWWNNVESKPYGGYPQHWDARLLAMLEAANPGGQSWDAGPADGGPPPRQTTPIAASAQGSPGCGTERQVVLPPNPCPRIPGRCNRA